MNRLLMHYETALEYVDMDEGLFEAFISPQVAALMFGGEPKPTLHLVE